MTWTRVVIPILILLIMAILVLILVMHQRRKSQDIDRKERLAAEKRWDGNCRFDNPDSGAKCERQEFHLENHYHDVNGRLVHWP